ncbi:hypothetical protein NE237_029257 [Protea cynaroides]|uniref:Reverse transcriptase/retrotransposon-derived protein RNase H-like domain-containing protein n=1 Tax=Protea cynaroides TaxID=273540 RepID=A0A9Q0GRY2_9MAGN|nr:hypothetical protein NE237_029257 [Protea cynaroides]
MLKKNQFEWTQEVVEAFNKLKEDMTRAPVLALPDFSKPFIVECDASRSGVGAVLMQERPIAFFSQALQGRNLLLSTYEKEILALVLAVQKWHSYLVGQKFVVRTDHKSLQYLWSQKISTLAHQRWLYKLMMYDFKVEYKKGHENIVADALSHQGDTEGKEGSSSTIVAISSPLADWLTAIKEEIKTNPKAQQLFQ